MNLLRDPVLKENPFRVPEGYFEGFAKRLEEEMKRQEADPALRDPVRLQRDPVRLQRDPVRLRRDPVRLRRDPVRLRRIAIAAAINTLPFLQDQKFTRRNWP